MIDGGKKRVLRRKYATIGNMKQFLLLIVAIISAVACKDAGPPPIALSTPVVSSTALLEVAATPTLFVTPTEITSLQTPTTTTTASAKVATPTPIKTIIPPDPPSLRERLASAENAMQIGDYAQAVEHYGAIVGASGDGRVRSEARLNLGIAHFANQNYTAARAILNQVLAEDDQNPLAYYYRGQISAEQNNCKQASKDFTTLLDLMPAIRAYIFSWLGECALADGAMEQAIAYFEQAQNEPSNYLTTYQQRSTLAQLYRDTGAFDLSAEIYNQLLASARTDFTRGEVGYQLAQLLLQSGDREAGFATLQQLVSDYPTQNTTYLGLVELVGSGVVVDQYQRGLIDYYAEAYLPCIDAFNTYLAENPDKFNDQALLYLAWCYEGVGNLDSALATLEEYADLSRRTDGEGRIEQGHLLRRQGKWADAFDVYAELVEKLPTNSFASEALYWMAVIRDVRGESEEAITLYRQLADDYPDAKRAARGLFRAGFLANANDQPALAATIWRDGATAYPNDYHGEASLVWLIGLDGLDAELREIAQQYTLRDAFYSVRLHDLLAGNEAFAKVEAWELVLDQDSAEATLKTLLDLDPATDIATLPTEIKNDLHLIRAEQLWQLRRFEAAKLEFETLRESYSSNILASYQLALYFREVGLYRSMIIAAKTVIDTLDLNPFTAPKFLAGLAYPVEYGDLIFPLAEQYDYDPFVHFALVRQESLYESFATSFAAAQGLAQVIPDTGYYIAEKLAWPDYENADLFKPYVGLTFGAFYLNEQLDYFERTVPPALAAYNAGPGNAYNWWKAADDNIDSYTETISFAETRLYIETIYTGHAIYRHLYEDDNK